ncbi:Peroxisome biosynthesis protein pex1 [Taxawa tesnikishii (nom. ined.)]|nr:Peroxisome biosynthesis protein pex1 [Dothideales sp. JES 119]
MAPVKRAASSASQAEVVLLPQLKSCLLNLPSSLVAVLLNANTIAQNVVVELSYRQPTAPGTDSKPSAASKQQSVYLGWTGMPSKSKLAPLVGKDGLRTGRTGGGRQDQSVDTVEIDTTFARVLGIVEGQKVGVTLHIDPPQVHTVHIEPLTPTDWEIIELHSRFLEMNFLSQIRALPHPHVSKQHHPLTLHLTPTSTANVLVTSLEPSATQAQQFFKISPDAEVIVAPKVRESSSRDSRRESRSVASTSRKSMGGWSAASNTRHRSVRDESTVRRPVFLRGVDRSLANGWFDEVDSESADLGLRIWVDPELLLTKGLKGVTWAATSLVRPANLQEVIDPQAQAMESERPATKVVARLVPWEDAPDKRHAALSSMLCATLGLVGFVGLVIKVEAAPAQVAKTTSVLKQTTPKEVAVKNLRIFPFTMSGTLGSSAIKFGGESEAEKAAAVQRVRALFGGDEEAPGLLEGPLTDGMVLPAEAGKDDATAWPGGVLRFDPISLSPESAKKPVTWLLGAERKLGMTVQAPISRPPEIAYSGPGKGCRISSRVWSALTL